MSSTVQSQHPAVVLRSSYLHLRALLAIAAFAIVGLTVAVVVLAITNSTTTISPAAHATPKAITSNPVVQPNPDEHGQTPSPLGSNSSYYYPGHY